MGTFARMAFRSGEDFVYTEFAEGATDAYGDKSYTADSTPDTIRGVRSDGGNHMSTTQVGEERKVDIAVIVANPLKNSAGVAVNILDDLTSRAPTLIDGAGRVYKIVGVGHEAVVPVGSQRLLCVRQAG